MISYTITSYNNSQKDEVMTYYPTKKRRSQVSSGKLGMAFIINNSLKSRGQNWVGSLPEDTWERRKGVINKVAKQPRAVITPPCVFKTYTSASPHIHNIHLNQ